MVIREVSEQFLRPSQFVFAKVHDLDANFHVGLFGSAYAQEPFDLHLLEISGGNEDIKKHAGQLYNRLCDSGISVLYDDRDLRAGEKFTDADLIGIPERAILSERTFAEGKIELVDRKTGESTLVTEEELLGAR